MIPTCIDQTELTDKFWDTIAVETTLFNMQYDDPYEEFKYFRSDWQDLTWTLVSSTLAEAEVVQDEADDVNKGRKNLFEP